MGNKYRVCGVYTSEPHAEVHCFRLNFNMSNLVYCVNITFFTITTEIHSYYNNVMTKFMLNNTTDA